MILVYMYRAVESKEKLKRRIKFRRIGVENEKEKFRKKPVPGP